MTMQNFSPEQRHGFGVALLMMSALNRDFESKNKDHDGIRYLSEGMKYMLAKLAEDVGFQITNGE